MSYLKNFGKYFVDFIMDPDIFQNIILIKILNFHTSKNLKIRVPAYIRIDALKAMIEQLTEIKSDQQILVFSGTDITDLDKRISAYALKKDRVKIYLISLQEIKQLLNKYQKPANFELLYSIEKKISSGAFGTIHTLRVLASGKVRILKVVCSKDLVYTTSFLNFVSLLKVLEHPNIMKIYDIYFKQLDKKTTEISIVCEYLEETLYDFIKKKKTKGKVLLKLEEIIHIFTAICKGLQYLFSNKIAHGDFKTLNIMRDNENNWKLIDYDTPYSSFYDQMFGTKGYMSPEYLQIIQDNTNDINSLETKMKNDIWSLGVVLYLMIYLEFPYFSKYDKIPYPIDHDLIFLKGYDIPDSGKDLIMNIFTRPEKRIELNDILKHPFLNEISQKILQTKPKIIMKIPFVPIETHKTPKILNTENFKENSVKIKPKMPMVLEHPFIHTPEKKIKVIESIKESESKVSFLNALDDQKENSSSFKIKKGSSLGAIQQKKIQEISFGKQDLDNLLVKVSLQLLNSIEIPQHLPLQQALVSNLKIDNQVNVKALDNLPQEIASEKKSIQEMADSSEKRNIFISNKMPHEQTRASIKKDNILQQPPIFPKIESDNKIENPIKDNKTEQLIPFVDTLHEMALRKKKLNEKVIELSNPFTSNKIQPFSHLQTDMAFDKNNSPNSDKIKQFTLPKIKDFKNQQKNKNLFTQKNISLKNQQKDKVIELDKQISNPFHNQIDKSSFIDLEKTTTNPSGNEIQPLNTGYDKQKPNKLIKIVKKRQNSFINQKAKSLRIESEKQIPNPTGNQIEPLNAGCDKQKPNTVIELDKQIPNPFNNLKTKCLLIESEKKIPNPSGNQIEPLNFEFDKQKSKKLKELDKKRTQSCNNRKKQSILIESDKQTTNPSPNSFNNQIEKSSIIDLEKQITNANNQKEKSIINESDKQIPNPTGGYNQKAASLFIESENQIPNPTGNQIEPLNTECDKQKPNTVIELDKQIPNSFNNQIEQQIQNPSNNQKEQIPKTLTNVSEHKIGQIKKPFSQLNIIWHDPNINMREDRAILERDSREMTIKTFKNYRNTKTF